MLPQDSSPPGGPAPGARPVADGNTDEFELLACVACRSRKLKCDRSKPSCNRCVKLKAECAYPESRRKPAPKRRNVKALEERLGAYILSQTVQCTACIMWEQLSY